VKKIVEGHRGTVEVESKENEGTAFSVRLPLLRRAQTPGTSAG
jgi:signal transduction histidine kinase